MQVGRSTSSRSDDVSREERKKEAISDLYPEDIILRSSTNSFFHGSLQLLLHGKVSWYRSSDLRTHIMQCTQASLVRTHANRHIHMQTKHFSVVVGESVHVVFYTHLQWKSSLWGNFGHQALFLALLKFPEVFLNQECGIELPHCYFIICWARKHTLRFCLLCWVEVMLLPAFFF